ncbi:SOS response-associated peptidase family protein [Rhizobium sp. TH2]|uniref:SOS response-associated peptidase family protein n=1 Tax=Rhizobium sp. TH2 TaxID=2775403 RepID=UPI0021578F46|nr:SOS response-associated peptidase family protein [Rhizobium sp. TH2]UVC10497.1 SOS response-associated peptidase family protein [Rhizobium sp. TH2]
MSRLFTNIRPMGEIADYFGVEDEQPIAMPSETVEGTQGLIVVERDGKRLLKSLPWGFPRQTREMRLNGQPPGRIGLVAELANPMWEHLVVDPRYRCLIPITHFANPEGEAGKKTRVWFSLTDEPMAAWAGFCRSTPEFGSVFAGMTTTANDLIMPFNERMPVILRKEEWYRWLHGSISDVIEFEFREPLPSEMFNILHTRDRWQSGMPPREATSRKTSSVIMV